MRQVLSTNKLLIVDKIGFLALSNLIRIKLTMNSSRKSLEWLF